MGRRVPHRERERAVLGPRPAHARRGAIVEKDPELVPVRGVLLFALRAEAEFIEKAGERLQILNFGERGRALSPLEIVLYVKRAA